MINVTLKELMEFIKPKGITGNEGVTVHRVDPVDTAQNGSLTFSAGPLKDTDASVVICSEGTPRENQALILVDNPRLWFIRCMRQFFSPEDDEPQIHPTATINWLVVSIGQRVRIGPGARIGFDGFGYEKNKDNAWEHFPHRGRVIIGDDVDIGANTCVDRGTLEDTVIENGVKIDNLVHVAHNVRIGPNSIIIAGTVIGGGVKIGRNVWLSINSSIRDYITVGDDAQIGMGAVVTKNIPAGKMWWIGNPAREMKK